MGTVNVKEKMTTSSSMENSTSTLMTSRVNSANSTESSTLTSRVNSNHVDQRDPREKKKMMKKISILISISTLKISTLKISQARAEREAKAENSSKRERRAVMMTTKNSRANSTVSSRVNSTVSSRVNSTVSSRVKRKKRKKRTVIRKKLRKRM